MATVAGDLVTGSLSATGTIGPYQPFQKQYFNVTISGTIVGDVQLQKSTDGGVTYVTIQPPELAGIADFTNPASFAVYEPSAATLYQVNLVERTSGTLNVRMGTS